MPAAVDLLGKLRTFLVAEDVGRLPHVSGTEPPIWIMPPKGIPRAGDNPGATVQIGEDATISLIRSTGIVTERHQSFMRNPAVTIFIDTSLDNPKLGEQIDQQIYDLLHDRRNFMLDTLQCHEARQFRDLQLLRSDERGWTYTTEYLFWVWSNPDGDYW